MKTLTMLLSLIKVFLIMIYLLRNKAIQNKKLLKKIWNLMAVN